MGAYHHWDNMPSKAQRFLDMKSGAVATMGYWLDNYPGGNVVSIPKYGKAGKNAVYPQTLGGADVAVTWNTVPFNPAAAGGTTGAASIPPGKYAILGAQVTSMTNYGLIRFQHKDFNGLLPGFPVLDQSKASARAVVNTDDIFQQDGYQFSALSEILKIPCCPTFNVTAQGTGLIIWVATILTDTPQVTLNLVALG